MAVTIGEFWYGLVAGGVVIYFYLDGERKKLVEKYDTKIMRLMENRKEGIKDIIREEVQDGKENGKTMDAIGSQLSSKYWKYPKELREIYEEIKDNKEK